MRLIKATKQYSKEISKLMMIDLKNPNPKFPQEMINKFREHSEEKKILQEFENPKLMAFLAVERGKLVGFIIGYKLKDIGMIHYITAKKFKVKEELLKRFIKESKFRKINKIITDTFEFMGNSTLFKSKGFILTKKEKLAKNLEMLWYELKL
jgi:hypothetical protein